MNSDLTSETDVRRDWFVRLAGVIGDFGNPFYGEERQRDVWNEASAFGLQLMLWLGLLTSTGLVWAGGSTAVPYALGLIILIGLIALVTSAYARRLGVDVETSPRVLRLRLVPYAAVLGLLIVGIIRARGLSDSLSLPFAVGLVIGGAAAVITIARRSR